MSKYLNFHWFMYACDRKDDHEAGQDHSEKYICQIKSHHATKSKQTNKRNFSMNCSVKKTSDIFLLSSLLVTVIYFVSFSFGSFPQRKCFSHRLKKQLFFTRDIQIYFHFSIFTSKARVITLFYTWAQFKLFIVLKSETKLVFMLHY